MSTKSVKAPRERSVVFYKKRATELAQTVLKLEAQVAGLEQSKDLAWQRTTQAEKDVIATIESVKTVINYMRDGSYVAPPKPTEVSFFMVGGIIIGWLTMAGLYLIARAFA